MPEDLGLDFEERVPLAALVDEDFLLWLRRLGPASWRGGGRFISCAGALRLGVVHGLDCLGCCAGLMVGLVALGMMNLAWMLTAAVIIFAEKTIPNSHRIAQPVGVVMVAGGAVLLAKSLLGGMAPGMESM